MLIDVRTPEEYAQKHAKGAINLPLDQIEDQVPILLRNLPKETPIEVYCHSGFRSGIAKNHLNDLGFKHVENLGGLQEII